MFNRKTLLSYITALLLIGFLCPPAFSYYYDSIDKIKFQGYNGEGSFVENPAYCGDCFGYVLGAPMAALISWPQRIGNYNEASDDVGVAILKCTTKPCGVFFGGFPWMLKKAFWDFPIWIGGGDISSPSPYEYKPEPVPVPEVPSELQHQPKVKLNEASATTAQPKLTDVVEPAPIPQKKADIPPLPVQNQTDTQNIQTPAVNIPSNSSENRINDQTPKSSSQSWETPQVPEWLNNDLTQ